ncbi:MAG: hypothetical protein WKG07_03545 [Hymenobacter sp.]
MLGIARLVVAADTVLCPGSAQAFRLRATPAGGTWSGAGRDRRRACLRRPPRRALLC